MEKQIFEFDVEKYKKQFRKDVIKRMWELPLFMGLVYFFIPEDFFKQISLLEPLCFFKLSGVLVMILILIFVIIVMEVILFCFMKYNPFGIEKMTLEFLEDRFLINRDKTKEEIIYSNVIKYKVYKPKENEIKYVDLITNKSKIRIWHFINMDELYLQLKAKFENKQEQVISRFNKTIEYLKSIIMIGLFIVAINFTFRYYKYEISLFNSILFFYIGLIYIFFIRKPLRAIEYKSTFVLDPALNKYFGIAFLILSLGMLIMYILTTSF